MASGGDPLACRLPEVVAPYITVPMFAVGSMFDPAVDSIVANTGGGNATLVNDVAAKWVGLINATVVFGGSTVNGAFLTGCHQHAGQWGQGQSGGPGPDDFLVVIDGDSQIGAFDAWLAAVSMGVTPARRYWLQSAVYPCDSCCVQGDATV